MCSRDFFLWGRLDKKKLTVHFVPIFKFLTFMGNDMLSMAQNAKPVDVERRFCRAQGGRSFTITEDA